MIIDQLANISTPFYTGLLTAHGGTFALADRLMAAFRFLQDFDPSRSQPQTVEIDGKRVYAMIQHYETKLRAQGAWEAHRRYLDVQYVAAGAELMGYVNFDQLQAGEYNESADFLFLQGEGNFLHMPAGTFVILGPQDAHMPGMAVNEQPQAVKKVVVKVAIG